MGCQHWIPNQLFMDDQVKPEHHRSSIPIGKVASLLLEESKGALFIKSIVIADGYALATTLAAEIEGQTLLRNHIFTGWNIKYHGSGAMGYQDLTREGVPPAIATKLLEKQVLQQRHHQENLEDFRQAWKQVNPKIAPFLGYWAAGDIDRHPDTMESSLSLWPQKDTDRVCIIGMGRGVQYVTVGEIGPGNRLSHASDVFWGRSTSGDNGVFTVLTRELPRQGNNEYNNQKKEPQQFYAAAPLNDWYFSSKTLDAIAANHCTKALP